MKTFGRNDAVVPSRSEDGQSSLVSKNITIFNRRTSVRLEPEMWAAIADIADREKCSIHDICSLVYVRKKDDTSLTAAIRVFLMLYYQSATTEAGHVSAGHGDFDSMKKRARITPEQERLFKSSSDRKKKFPSSYAGHNDN